MGMNLKAPKFTNVLEMYNENCVYTRLIVAFIETLL